MGSSSKVVRPEEVLESLKNDGSIDALRMKIIAQLKANEDMKKNTMMMVEQSKVLNTPGAEKKTKRELFDALRQELEGTCDGDFCAVEVKKMEVAHWSKKVHLGFPVSSIEFCPTERVVISTSHQWGAEITKLDVPPEWKVWQIWLVLLSLFVSSAVLFYVLFKHVLHLRP